MSGTYDVAIVGGGLNGPVLALALAQAGLTSVVIDASSADAATDGRAYALAHASTLLLDALGLWDALEDHAQSITEIKASDGRAGEGAAPFFLHFDSAEIEEGPMGHMLEDRHLRPALHAAMEAEPRVTVMQEARVVAQGTDGPLARLKLEDGQEVAARVVAGADGRGSGTAERAGIGRMRWDYGQTALVAVVDHERPHGGVAHQFFMPAGPLAILPLPGNRSSIVWSETHAEAERVMALDTLGFVEHLRPRFGSFLGEIAVEGPRFSYPLGLSLAERFVAPRLALVGDAAHGIHPIAGQGLNLGLRDVAALAEVLAEARRRGEDIGAEDVLARYQTWRRFDSTLLALSTDLFNRLFSNDNPLLRAVRDLGMGIVSATPALRRGFIREAAGLTGDRPRLLRGERL